MAVLAGCAALKAEDVKVYTPAQLKQGEYQTVARLWVETWRPAFWVPSYSSPKDGIAAMQDKAAGLGANGLINVDCYGGRGLFSFGSESFIAAIRGVNGIVSGKPEIARGVLPLRQECL